MVQDEYIADTLSCRVFFDITLGGKSGISNSSSAVVPNPQPMRDDFDLLLQAMSRGCWMDLRVERILHLLVLQELAVLFWPARLASIWGQERVPSTLWQLSERKNGRQWSSRITIP